ncbi:MAG: hypothetical protein ACK42E_04060, partial [Candidatus Bipolaricaulaceae bacterium]
RRAWSEPQEAVRIVIVYDNVARPPLREGWGFSAFLELGSRKILFGAGADRLLLAHNAQALGLDFPNGSASLPCGCGPHCAHLSRGSPSRCPQSSELRAS